MAWTFEQQQFGTAGVEWVKGKDFGKGMRKTRRVAESEGEVWGGAVCKLPSEVRGRAPITQKLYTTFGT